MRKFRMFIDQAPLRRETVVLVLGAALFAALVLPIHPQFALLAPVVIFGWTQVSTG